jgi:two-component system NarL family sensor kinase
MIHRTPPGRLVAGHYRSGGCPAQTVLMSVAAGRAAVAATVLFGIAVVEILTTIVAGRLAGMSWTAGDNVLVITNAINGFALALAGWPIAANRPRNPIGWLLLVGGCFYISSATGYALLENATRADAGRPFWRLLAMLTDATWAPALTFFLPVALLLFPEGRLPGRWWRVFVGAAAIGTVALFTAGLAGVPQAAAERGIHGYLGANGFAAMAWLSVVGLVGALITFGAALAALIVRFRRAPQGLRRQLSWPLLALLVVFAEYTIDPLLGDNVFSLLITTAIPISITLAIFRRQLFDIQLVFSRSLVYVLLTGGIVGAYLALVALFALFFGARGALGPSVLATIIVAAGFNPVRVFLQRLVDRAIYGAREDPVRAIAAVGARLGEVGTPAGAGLDAVLEALCRVMHLPSATITVHGTQVAAYGSPSPDQHVTPLEHGDERLGDLVVGLRTGESRLAPADLRVLTLLATPIAVAVRANELTDELLESRERVITGREEERRRLRRDLHDGLGPVLTGVVLNAEAALRLVDSDPRRSGELLTALRDQTTAALDDIRRLVYELRPPALDSLGLVGALHEYAMILSRRADGEPLEIALDAPDPLPDLPAAVEVAAYRIATEALTNVTRHSSASTATIRLAVTDAGLQVSVHDDGVNVGGGWPPGVGLTSIRERAAELGGSCTIQHDRTGGRVDVLLPLPAPAPERSPVAATGETAAEVTS